MRTMVTGRMKTGSGASSAVAWQSRPLARTTTIVTTTRQNFDKVSIRPQLEAGRCGGRNRWRSACTYFVEHLLNGRIGRRIEGVRFRRGTMLRLLAGGPRHR